MSYDEDAARARRLDSGGDFEDLRSDTTPSFFHQRPRSTPLEALSADVRQWPLRNRDDVVAIKRKIDRMATDAGWQPHSNEVYEAQRAARTWTYQRFIGMVANRTMMPWELAEVAQAIMDKLRV